MPFIHVYIKLGAHDHGAGALLHPHREAVAGLRYLNGKSRYFEANPPEHHAVLRSNRFFATMVVSSLAKNGRDPSAGERW